MSVYRFTHPRDEELLAELIAIVAEQDGVDPSDVRVKRDPHPAAPLNDIVLCTTDELDHWPSA